MKVRPLHDQIVVKRAEEVTVSRGGIFIPGNAQEKSIEGEVLAVGTGMILDSGAIVPLEVKVGDRVLMQKHAYTEIKIEGEEYLILREDNVLVIIDP